jgi:hypothetical protein
LNRRAHGRARGSAARRLNAETIDDETLDWENGCAAADQCILPVVAESRPQKPWVGLLTRKERVAQHDSRAASPSPAVSRVTIEATRLHLQWRDRAGFAPASPLCPVGHPRRNAMLTHRLNGSVRGHRPAVRRRVRIQPFGRLEIGGRRAACWLFPSDPLPSTNTCSRPVNGWRPTAARTP